ncbi:hypothetical protein ACRJ4W_53780 [Streptomyces sp. GLT-R25]
MRTAYAAALTVLCLTAPMALATPAGADPHSQCTVNGVAPDSGTARISGTSGVDIIECDGNVGFTIDGKAGNDKITIAGVLHRGAAVYGDSGDDTITVAGIGSAVGSDAGSVVGGDGGDIITVSGGVTGGSVVGNGGNDVIQTGGVTRWVNRPAIVRGDDGDDKIATGGVAGPRSLLSLLNVPDPVVSGGVGADMIRTGAIGQGGEVSRGPGADDIEAASVGAKTAGRLWGAEDNDRISGTGNTPLPVGPGRGTVDGGAGTDTCNTKKTGRGMVVGCP